MATLTTTLSRGSRIKKGISGVLIGFVMIGLAVSLLWWNEGRIIKQRTSLNELQKDVISVTGFDSNNNSKAIHYADMLTASGSLEYPLLQIAEEDGLKFLIRFDVLQWQETSQTTTKNAVGGSQTQTVTYSYEQKWTDEKIDATLFEGPDAASYNNTYVNLENLGLVARQDMNMIYIGDYSLGNQLVSMLDNYQPYRPTEKIRDQIILATQASLPTHTNVTLQGDTIYVTQLSGVDTIGDMRMMFHIIRDQKASVIGKQVDQTIQKYTTSNGIEHAMIVPGELSAQTMLADAKQANELMKRIIRIGGVMILFFGFMLLFRPLVVVADIVPFAGSVVEMGLGLISAILTVLIATITTGIAWIRFSPLIGITVLAGGIVCTIGLIQLRKKISQKMTQKVSKSSYESESESKKLLGSE